jgi:hypothetical protein
MGKLDFGDHLQKQTRLGNDLILLHSQSIDENWKGSIDIDYEIKKWSNILSTQASPTLIFL